MVTLTRPLAVAAAMALLSAPVAVLASSPASAAGGTYYANCDALHKKFPHGVAKSKKAAKRAVRDGYGRPATSKKAKKVYRTNKSRLDRDRDGTACEA